MEAEQGPHEQEPEIDDGRPLERLQGNPLQRIAKICQREQAQHDAEEDILRHVVKYSPAKILPVECIVEDYPETFVYGYRQSRDQQPKIGVEQDVVSELVSNIQ